MKPPNRRACALNGLNRKLLVVLPLIGVAYLPLSVVLIRTIVVAGDLVVTSEEVLDEIPGGSTPEAPVEKLGMYIALETPSDSRAEPPYLPLVSLSPVEGNVNSSRR